MSKVLTYHTDSTGEHWFTYESYKKKHIDSIIDPERGNTDSPPTSIPSPFAQMDLVKTAFRNLAKDEDLKGTRIDFKLVSDSLDLGELLFNKDKFASRIQIITWDKKHDLGRLKESNNPRHRRLGDVLELYLTQDAEAYNFNKFSRLFLVQFDNDYNKVVGGTSPATLFFTSSNDLSYAKLSMPNNYTLFDNKYVHLYDREADFQRYLYALKKAMPEFGSTFREVSEYMDNNLRILERKNRTLYQEITRLSRDDYFEKFDELNTGTANDKVYVNGFLLRKRKAGSQEVVSDFTITPNPEKRENFKDKPLPLVLSQGHDGFSRRGEPMKYYNGNFQKGTPIPHYSDITNFNDRDLPGLSGTKYPHILISDFLEPYLVRFVFPLNEKSYFNGNIKKGKESRGFLLPIKMAYFDYFTVQDLMLGRTRRDKKPFFEMEVISGEAVRVTLRVPIKEDYIAYERIYYPNLNIFGANEPDLEKNSGVIVENQFSTTIFPMIKISDDKLLPPDYRVMLVDRDIANHTIGLEYDLNFYKEQGNAIKPESKIIRSQKTDAGASGTTNIYVLKESFDIIQVDNQQARGILIPKFITKTSGNREFFFAVDFGTTFTHVEYKIGANGSPRPFEITPQDIQIGTLHDPMIGDDDERYGYLNSERAGYLIDRPNEIFPEKIGSDFNYKFPQRTVIAERKGINFANPTYAVADFNIPFIYEKKKIPVDTSTSSNLKWSNYGQSGADRRRVEAFFEKLLFMMRAKVILNGGDLSKTKMIWFYPSSMMEGRVNKLEGLWNKAYKTYISNESPKKISESIAPFYFYREKWRVSAANRPVVAIDIGGGTSDVVVYEKNEPVVLTSFKFAANSIFGDGFSTYGNISNNGFVLKYESTIKQLLESNRLVELISVLGNVKEGGRSTDMVAFFFSLQYNRKIKSENIPISFSNMLSEDDDMRILFVVFYVAIIYHIAKLMKAQNQKMPRYITFSGNGSRVLRYVSESDQTLGRLARLIFEKIYDQQFDSDGLNVIRELEQPKEATCKGGLMMDDSDYSFDKIDNIKTALLGIEDDRLVNDISYNDLDEEIKQSFKKAFEAFVQFVSELNKSFNFNAKLNVNPTALNKGLDLLRKDIIRHLNEGINLKQKEMLEEDKVIEETLFFYPLIGTLNQLAYEIANDSIPK